MDDDFIPDEIVALSGEEEEFDDEIDNDPGSQVVSGKRKRREKEKERKAKKRKLAEAVEHSEISRAFQPPRELANYLASMQLKSFSKLSALELDDFRIPDSCIADTTSWMGPRTLDQLVDFIQKVLPSLRLRLSQKSKSNGAPTLLYVAGAALRVADVTRILKNKKLQGDKGGDVAKLFAKHFKISQHVAYLKRTKIGSAVGTPGRLGKLINETDALNLSALSHIFLDITYKDPKNRNLLDIPETRDEVFQTVLNNQQILEGIRAGKIQLVLF